MTDENPILRGLLDSLTTFNRRLSIIEKTLLPPSAAPPTASRQGGNENGNGHGWNTGPSTYQWPLPKCVPSSASSTSSASSPSCTAHSALLPPPSGNAPNLFIDRPRRHKRLRLQHERIKEEDSRVENNLFAHEVRPTDSDEDNDTREDKDEEGEEEEGEEDKKNNPFREQIDGQPGRTGAAIEGSSSQEPQPADAGDDRLEALPEGFLISGRATLQEELDGWTLPRGYSMRINGTRSHGRRQKIRMVCFRGGRSRLRPKEESEQRDRDAENNGGGGSGGNDYYDQDHSRHGPSRRRQRKPTTDRVSKKCECPFRFELVEVCPGADRYAVHYTNDDHRRHNHAAADLMLDPRARKLPAALKDEVDQWLRGARSMYSTDTVGTEGEGGSAGGPWTIAKIQAELQRRGYGHVLDFDLRNRKRALLHKERMAAQLKAGNASSALTGGTTGNSS